MLTPTQKYQLLRDTDPDKLTPELVKQLRQEAAATGEGELTMFLREIVGEGVATPKTSKSLLLG